MRRARRCCSCSARAPISTPRRCWRRCCCSGLSTRPSPAGSMTKPWSWADTWPVARIEVKRHRASAIVLAGSSGQALAFGPGHVELTADAGERGVAVYSAHRDTHFAFLRNVKIGDEIDVTRDDGKDVPLPRRRQFGRAFRRFRDRSAHRRLRTGAVDLLAVRCADPGPERYLLHATLMDLSGSAAAAQATIKRFRPYPSASFRDAPSVGDSRLKAQARNP